jgi:hypothetical protein
MADSVRDIVSPQITNWGRMRPLLRYNGSLMTRSIARWIPWWYAAIAVGFLLLAIVHLLSRDKWWLVAIRLVIAGGFGFLSWMEIHSKDRRSKQE